MELYLLKISLFPAIFALFSMVSALKMAPKPHFVHVLPGALFLAMIFFTLLAVPYLRPLVSSELLGWVVNLFGLAWLCSVSLSISKHSVLFLYGLTAIVLIVFGNYWINASLYIAK